MCPGPGTSVFGGIGVPRTTRSSPRGCVDVVDAGLDEPVWRRQALVQVHHAAVHVLAAVDQVGRVGPGDRLVMTRPWPRVELLRPCGIVRIGLVVPWRREDRCKFGADARAGRTPPRPRRSGSPNTMCRRIITSRPAASRTVLQLARHGGGGVRVVHGDGREPGRRLVGRAEGRRSQRHCGRRCSPSRQTSVAPAGPRSASRAGPVPGFAASGSVLARSVREKFRAHDSFAHP